MTRSIAAAILGTVLLAGCAALDSGGGESELVERVRDRLAVPELLGTQVTVTERDGDIVLHGFVDTIEEIEAVRAAVESVDGVRSVDNNVIMRPSS